MKKITDHRVLDLIGRWHGGSIMCSFVALFLITGPPRLASAQISLTEGVWSTFSFGGPGSSWAENFTFTISGASGTLYLTDAFIPGDSFSVTSSIDGFLGITSDEIGSGPNLVDYDAAFLATYYSSGSFALSAGTHIISGIAIDSPSGSGGAGIRFTQTQITTVDVIDNVLDSGLDFNTASNWTSVNPNAPTIHLLPGTDNTTGTTLVNNIIQDGVSATLSSSFTAANSFDNLIIRGGASLGISADLTADTTFDVAGSSNGFVNQTAGTVTVTDLIVGETGQTASTYSLSGGTLNVSNGGTLAGTSAINVSGTGAFDVTNNLALTDSSTFSVQGDSTTVSLGSLTVGAGSTLNFVLGATGVNAIALTGTLNINTNSLLTVDGTAFTPEVGEWNLITAGSVAGFVDPSNITLSNFGVLRTQVVNIGHNILLQLSVPVIDNVFDTSGDFNTAANWQNTNPAAPIVNLLPGTDSPTTGSTLVNNIIQNGVSATLSSNFTAANSFDNLIVRGGASLGIGFDLSGATNFTLGDGSTSGTVSQTAGTVSVDTLEVLAGSSYTISGGAFTSTSDVTLDGGIFSLSGNTATVSVGGNLELKNGATLAYVLGTDGVIPTAVTGGFSTDATSGITVDGGAFTPAGEFTTIDLLTASGVTGFDPDNNFAFSNFGALVPQVVIDGGVSLIVIDPVPQLFYSAIPMNLALGQLGSQLHHQASSGINSRLFRARGRTTSDGNGTTQTSGDTLETGGRELPASRNYRNGRELRMETSINLDGTPRRTANSTEEETFQTATLHDDAPFLSVERPAGASLDPGVLASGDKWMIYSSANFGNVGLDNLGANPGFESYTYSSTLGFEYQFSEELALGLGWSHVWNDNTMNGGLGTADLEGDAAIAYATYFKNNFWADLLYSYGSYEADIRRIAGGGTSVASPDLEAHLLSLNLGYNIEGDFTGTRLAQLTEGENRLVHGPTLGIDYSTGTLDGYTETGNFPFDAAFAEQDYDSLVTTLGWQATVTRVKSWGQLRPQLRLGYGQEHLSQNTSVTGSLAGNPIITATGTAISPGDNWMEVGAGVSFQLNDSNLTVYLDYTGQYFREDAEVHYATLGAEVKF